MTDYRLPGQPARFMSDIPPPAAASFTPPAGADLPVGAVFHFAGIGFEHPSFLLCGGDWVLKSEYPELLAVLGTHWGTPADPLYFQLPNLRGRFVIAPNSAAPALLTFTTGGEHEHTLTTTEMPAHGHNVRSPNAPADGAFYDFSGGGAQTRTILRPNTGAVSAVSGEWSAANAGGGGPHNNMPPYIVMQGYIKARP